MHGQTMLLSLFLFTIFAGLAGAIWEWIGISRELQRHGEPQGGPGWDNHLKRKAESMARDPNVEEPPRMGLANALPIGPASRSTGSLAAR
jgi:hypothetical protein